MPRRPTPVPTCVVTIGGGSSTGLAKAIALTPRACRSSPCRPPTPAASRRPIYGLTGGRHKQTGKNLVVLPKAVVYDPELTLGLPPASPDRRRSTPSPTRSRRCTSPGHNPVTSASGAGGRAGDPRVAADGDGRARRSRARGRTCCTARTCRASRSARRRPACTTSSATCSAARSTSSTPTPTRSSCRTRSRSTRRSCRPRWPASPRRSARPASDPAGALWDLAVASNVPTSLADARACERDRTRRGGGACRGRDHRQPPARRPKPTLLGLLERAFDGQRRP